VVRVSTQIPFLDPQYRAEPQYVGDLVEVLQLSVVFYEPLVFGGIPLPGNLVVLNPGLLS
jgi:membrane protein DedA with SNARE-associated domain